MSINILSGITKAIPGTGSGSGNGDGRSDTIEGIEEFGSIELTEETIADLNAARPASRAVTIQPNKEGGGIENGVDLLRAVHSEKTAHAFEMRNINERIGFQYVMGSASARQKLKRQLEGFYPDSHVEIEEYDQPPLLPLSVGDYLAIGEFRLRRRENGEHLFPIRHVNNEGFANDPYNSISGEMVGERETTETTHVALQVMFKPAPKDWYRGRKILGYTLEKGIDDLERELKNPREEAGAAAAARAYANNDYSELKGRKRQPTDEETAEARFLLTQRGERGYHLNIRVYAVGDDEQATRKRVKDTCDMFEGYYDSTTEQGFEVVPLSGRALRHRAEAGHARQYLSQKMTMGLTATSGVMHIPDDSINTSNVEWAMTSFAGDVPASADRLNDYLDIRTGWSPDDRSHVNPEECAAEGYDGWRYDISATWDGYKHDPDAVEPDEPAEIDEDAEAIISALMDPDAEVPEHIAETGTGTETTDGADA